MTHGRVPQPEPQTPRQIVTSLLASQQMIEETYSNPQRFEQELEDGGFSKEQVRAIHQRKIAKLRERMNIVGGPDRRAPEQAFARKAKTVWIVSIALLLGVVIMLYVYAHRYVSL